MANVALVALSKNTKKGAPEAPFLVSTVDRQRKNPPLT